MQISDVFKQMTFKRDSLQQLKPKKQKCQNKTNTNFKQTVSDKIQNPERSKKTFQKQ